MKVRFCDIQWDTTENGDAYCSSSDPDLPSECILDVDDDIDLDTEGANALSDKYGWCVFSFNYEKIGEIR